MCISNTTIEKLIEFLQSEEVKWPKTRPKDSYYPTYLEGIFNDYFVKIDSFSASLAPIVDIQKKIAFVKEQADVIIEAVNKYLSGQPFEAYSILSDWLNKYFEDYKILIDYLTKSKFGNYKLYRVRVSEPGGVFEPKNLFHVPFELRHTINTKRFSIPGYPCIYAGSSLILCWKELGCPSFDNVYSVRIEPEDNQVRILDMGITPGLIAEYLIYEGEQGKRRKSDFDWNVDFSQDFFKDIATRILMWPLQSACMIDVLNKNMPFSPEYIVPQLILQYIKKENEKNIDGIRYFSTSLDLPVDDPKLGCNFVFPVKEIDHIGYCPQLIKLFKSTQVLSWQIAPDCSSYNFSGYHTEEIELVKGKKSFYSQTRFAAFEAILREMNVSTILTYC